MSDFSDFDIYIGGGNRTRPSVILESPTLAHLHIHKVPVSNVSKVIKKKEPRVHWDLVYSAN